LAPPAVDPDQLLTIMRRDKKVLADRLRFVLLERTGRWAVRDDVPDELVLDVPREQRSRWAPTAKNGRSWRCPAQPCTCPARSPTTATRCATPLRPSGCPPSRCTCPTSTRASRSGGARWWRPSAPGKSRASAPTATCLVSSPP